MLRTALGWVYRACGALAIALLAAVGVLVFASIVLRYFDILVFGLTDYAGYCMAASAFLALAYTFGQGDHIRIGLLLHFLHGRWRYAAEIWCLAIASFLAGYFAYYAIRMVRISYMMKDVSQGPDATPLWIPQLGVAIGGTVFAVAIAQRLIEVALAGELESAPKKRFTNFRRPNSPDG